MKALILAAGYATRLYPLTKEYPKPLLKISNRPIIDYIIDKLERIYDIDEIIIITNSKFIAKFQHWAEGLKTKKQISLVDDLTKGHRSRRGAIGDMSFAIDKKRIKDNLLVIGGDNLFDDDLDEFVLFAQANNRNPAIGVYNIKSILQAKKYGVVKLDKNNRLIDFAEKPEKPKSTLVATCIYYFSKAKLSLIRKYLNSKAGKHDATGFYINWLRKKIPVYAFVFSGRWYDIGDPKLYQEAKTFAQ